jgi:hypothetical protein
MNDTRERFLSLHLGAGNVALINKSYIVSISSIELTTAAPVDPEHGGSVASDHLELVD